MKSAIIVHGMPSEAEFRNPSNPKQSEDHWLGWLKKELTVRGITVCAPDFPEPYKPDYAAWKAVFERHAAVPDTMLIGHSLGAGFLVRWLSESGTEIGKVALVAPFLDPDHDEVSRDFFDFQIDPDMAVRTKGIAVFIDPADDREITESASAISAKIAGVRIFSLPGRGHFTADSMKTDAFPELLDFLLG